MKFVRKAVLFSLLLPCLTIATLTYKAEGAEVSAPSSVSGQVFQEGQMSMNVLAGYAMVNMKKFNTAMADFQEFVLQYFDYDDSEHLNKLSGAFHGGVELDFELIPGLKIGPRLDLFYLFPGEVYGLRDNALYTYDYEWTLTFDGMMIPITAGISYTTQSEGKVSFTFGLNLGLALAYAGMHSEYTTDQTSWAVELYRYDIPVSANGLYANLHAGMNLKLGSTSALFLRLGYRLANFGDLTVDETIRDSFPMGRINQGDKATDFMGDPLELDFSGLDFALGFCFGF